MIIYSLSSILQLQLWFPLGKVFIWSRFGAICGRQFCEKETIALPRDFSKDFSLPLQLIQPLLLAQFLLGKTYKRKKTPSVWSKKNLDLFGAFPPQTCAMLAQGIIYLRKKYSCISPSKWQNDKKCTGLCSIEKYCGNASENCSWWSLWLWIFGGFCNQLGIRLLFQYLSCLGVSEPGNKIFHQIFNRSPILSNSCPAPCPPPEKTARLNNLDPVCLWHQLDLTDI